MGSLSKAVHGIAFVASMLTVSHAGAAAEADVGVRFALMPIGTLKVSAAGESVSADMVTAFAVGPTVDVYATPTFSLGIAPQLVFNVKTDEDPSGSTQLDLPVRAAVYMGGYPVMPYSFFSMGYSEIFIPDTTSGPTGLIMSLGAGVVFNVGENTLLTTEVGYQWGFHNVNIEGIKIGLSTSFLHVGFGLRAKNGGNSVIGLQQSEPAPRREAEKSDESMPVGCTRDTDCKGDRVCQHGACVPPIAVSPAITQRLLDFSVGVPLDSDATKDEVLTSVKNQARSLSTCIMTAKEAGELVSGAIAFALEWTINVDGNVSNPRLIAPSDMLNTSLSSCIAQTMTKWSFQPGPAPIFVNNFPMTVRVP